MKQFIVFAGHNYYPEGGWMDFAGDFETIEEAIAFAESSPYAEHGWSHIVDTKLKMTVWPSLKL